MLCLPLDLEWCVDFFSDEGNDEDDNINKSSKDDNAKDNHKEYEQNIKDLFFSKIFFSFLPFLMVFTMALTLVGHLPSIEQTRKVPARPKAGHRRRR